MCPDLTHVVIKMHLTFESHPGYSTVYHMIKFWLCFFERILKSNNSDARHSKVATTQAVNAKCFCGNDCAADDSVTVALQGAGHSRRTAVAAHSPAV